MPTAAAPSEKAPLSTNADKNAGVVPHFVESHETWVSLSRWCKANNLAQPNRLAVVPVSAYALNTSNGALVLRGGSQLANWNGMELRLGFAPQMIDNQIFVNRLDLKKTVQPLLTRDPICAAKTNRVVVIDPGHGGENAGAKSILGNRYEKEFTLDWGRRLASILAADGWQVYLTRANDSDLALSNRVAVAEQRKADLFVSLHFNSSAPNEEQAGLETYCLTPSGMPSSLTRGFEDDARLIFPNNSFDSQNLQFACSVHRAVLRVNGNHDRGVRRARFPGVLRGQQRPAILVEGGYLSNPREARLIAEGSYRQKLAEAVANGIEEAAAGRELAANTAEGRTPQTARAEEEAKATSASGAAGTLAAPLQQIPDGTSAQRPAAR
jgi:N-acetylmuramoyl-L-alanine amidase